MTLRAARAPRTATIRRFRSRRSRGRGARSSVGTSSRACRGCAHGAAPDAHSSSSSRLSRSVSIGCQKPSCQVTRQLPVACQADERLVLEQRVVARRCVEQLGLEHEEAAVDPTFARCGFSWNVRTRSPSISSAPKRAGGRTAVTSLRPSSRWNATSVRDVDRRQPVAVRAHERLVPDHVAQPLDPAAGHRIDARCRRDGFSSARRSARARLRRSPVARSIVRSLLCAQNDRKYSLTTSCLYPSATMNSLKPVGVQRERCHSIGLPPISTIGLGRFSVSSDIRVPRPPARITVFTSA